MNMILGTDFEAQAFDLAMTRFDGSIFYAHLDCKRRVAESNPILLIALSTITDLKLN
jgi:hypothetical protein